MQPVQCILSLSDINNEGRLDILRKSSLWANGTDTGPFLHVFINEESFKGQTSLPLWVSHSTVRKGFNQAARQAVSLVEDFSWQGDRDHFKKRTEVYDAVVSFSCNHPT